MSVQDQLLAAHNAERKKRKRVDLTISDKLTAAAQKHAEWMADHHLMTHGNPFTRIKAEGYEYSYAGENIAAGQETVASVMKAWMSSMFHKKNILYPEYTEVGFGFKNNYWCVNFGKPKNPAPKPEPPPKVDYNLL